MARFWPSQNFSGIYTMIFTKKTTRVVSIPKIMKFIAAFGRYRPKTLKNVYFGQKWPNFDHFWPFRGSKNFSIEKIFGGHLSHMETQLDAKNQKKISNGQGCRTGTHERTHGRTYESEFIGSFRSLKTSGETIIIIK